MEGEDVSGGEGQRRDMTWDWVKQPRQRRPRGTLAPPTANTQKSAVLAVNLFLSRPCVSAYSGLYRSPQPHCPPHFRIEMFSKSSDESTGFVAFYVWCKYVFRSCVPFPQGGSMIIGASHFLSC